MRKLLISLIFKSKFIKDKSYIYPFNHYNKNIFEDKIKN